MAAEIQHDARAGQAVGQFSASRRHRHVVATPSGSTIDARSQRSRTRGTLAVERTGGPRRNRRSDARPKRSSRQSGPEPSEADTTSTIAPPTRTGSRGGEMPASAFWAELGTVTHRVDVSCGMGVSPMSPTGACPVSVASSFVLSLAEQQLRQKRRHGQDAHATWRRCFARSRSDRQRRNASSAGTPARFLHRLVAVGLAAGDIWAVPSPWLPNALAAVYVGGDVLHRQHLDVAAGPPVLTGFAGHRLVEYLCA